MKDGELVVGATCFVVSAYKALMEKTNKKTIRIFLDINIIFILIF
jgi:hypothetical protein